MKRDSFESNLINFRILVLLEGKKYILALKGLKGTKKWQKWHILLSHFLEIHIHVDLLMYFMLNGNGQILSTYVQTPFKLCIFVKENAKWWFK